MDKNVTNPSEVKYTGGIRSKGGTGEIKRFASPTEAYNDLYNDVHSKLNGGSSWVKPQTTVSEYISKFAPKEDHNDPKSYANSVVTTINKKLEKANSTDVINKNTSMSKVKNTLLKAGLDADHELTKAHLKIESPETYKAIKAITQKPVEELAEKPVIETVAKLATIIKPIESIAKTTPVKKFIAKPVIKQTINKPIKTVVQVKKELKEFNVTSIPVIDKKTSLQIKNKTIEVAKSTYSENKVGKINPPSSVPNDVEKLINEHKTNKKWGNYKSNYFVYSKEDSKFYVLNNKHQIIDSIVSGRGKDKGDDANTVNMNNKNSLQRKTTPAMAASISKIYDNEYTQSHYGTPMYSFFEDENGFLAAHGVSKGDYETRMNIINNKEIKDKLVSYGCLNIPKEFITKYRPSIGDSLFITKEPENI